MGRLALIRVQVMHGVSLLQAGLAATLVRQTDLSVVERCPTTLLQDAPVHQPQTEITDVVVTDYERGVHLAEALQRTRSSLPHLQPRIMIVTNRASQAEVRCALQLGVRGYLTHTSACEEVIDAVRKVHSGMRHVSEPLALRLLEDLLEEQLTQRESEVLRLAAIGCANKVIASRLQIAAGTVKCHMKSILEKLHANNRTEAVAIANQRGLLIMGSDTGSPREDSEATPWLASMSRHAAALARTSEPNIGRSSSPAEDRKPGPILWTTPGPARPTDFP